MLHLKTWKAKISQQKQKAGTAKIIEDAPFVPNHDAHLLPMNPFTSGMFQTGVFENSITFPVFCFCWNVLQPWKYIKVGDWQHESS